MPHASFKILPGVDEIKTPALNEAAISQSQLIRFMPDRTLGGIVQKLGGWTKYFSSTVGSTVRSLLAWEDIYQNSYLAVGADGIPAGGGGALQVITSGGSNDITPQTTTVNIAVSLSTTAGSNVVTVTHSSSNISNYDVVNFETQVSVGGIILFGQYQCHALGPNTYNVYAYDSLLDPYIATSTVTNGGSVAKFTLISESNYVTVTLNSHGYVVGQTFPILVASSIGGVTLYGDYEILQITDANNFVISATTQASKITVTGASGTGTNATLTYASAVTFVTGSTITVAGMNPSGYNGSYTVGSSTSGSVTYPSTETGTFVSGGTIDGQFSFYENNGQLRLLYQKGIGPLPQGTGYGVGAYGAGGYGTGIPPVSSSGTPINATDWTLDNWGQILIANPYGGGIYYWDPTIGNSNAQVIAAAPPVNNGAFVAMPQRQIVAWGSTFTGIDDPLLIRWCDVNNFNVWTALITNQAGSYRLPKGSKIVQCLQGPQQGLIWTDLSLWAMQYVGPPYIYQFNEVGTGCGLIGHKSAAAMNGIVYWMGQSQFFQFAGDGVRPVKCPIWDVVFQDLDTSNVDKIRVACNSRFMEVTWYYPTIGSNGENSNYVKYNVLLDQWDYGTLSRTAWINESVLGPPIGAGLNQYIYQHETSPDADGQAMDSWFQTGYFVMSEADVKIFIDQVWPDMKWGYYDGTQGANILMSFYVADYPGDTPKVYGPFTLTEATKFVTPRFRGRLVSIRIESNDIGSFWRLGNIRYRLQEDGKY
jgi:hypothetical protein